MCQVKITKPQNVRDYTFYLNNILILNYESNYEIQIKVRNKVKSKDLLPNAIY